MTIPRLDGQHERPAILTPEALMAHRIEQLGDTIPDDLPRRIVMTYQPQLLAAVQMLEPTSPIEVGGYCRTIHAVDRTGGQVGVVGGFGIGAPAAVAVLEELIALGTDSVISVGAAGGIADGTEVGDLVVCDRAVRDEGTSHHYKPADHPARADPDLTSAISARFTKRSLDHRVGSSWTTDGLFRETSDEVTHFAEHGALTVDMEAAALFIAAEYRSIPLGAAFCVSDLMTGGQWHAAFANDRFLGNMWNLVDAAVDTLTG